MTSELITCPNCGKKMPRINYCWRCGQRLDPELGKESPEEPVESGRNQSFFGREQDSQKEKNRMEMCKKHDWRPHPDNPKKVICGVCGFEQYKSKLSDNQLQELAKYERPTLTVEPTDLLMFVGKSYYTPTSFIAEARQMGACKRVPMLPRGVVKGVSKVFLAHEYDTGEAGDDGKTVYQSKVFAWFTVRGIIYVVSNLVNIPEALKERGVTEWKYVEGGFSFSGERGCGSLATGGTYLLSEEDMEKVRGIGESATVQGHIQLIDPPIPIGLKRFRGYKAVVGGNILNRLPEETWYEDAWDANQRNKKAVARFTRSLKNWKKEQEQEKVDDG